MTDKVILDTNILLLSARCKLDITNELARILTNPDVYVLEKTIKELEGLSTGNSKTAREAKLGLELVKHHKIRVLPTLETEKHLNADQILVRKAQAGEWLIATQDKEVKRSLRQHLVIRNLSHFELIG